MPVLVTSNFDDDSIKNERASMETPFSNYKSMGNFYTPKGSKFRSQWSDLAEIRTRPRFIACPRYLIQSATKHYVAFPYPSDATHKI